MRIRHRPVPGKFRVFAREPAVLWMEGHAFAAAKNAPMPNGVIPMGNADPARPSRTFARTARIPARALPSVPNVNARILPSLAPVNHVQHAQHPVKSVPITVMHAAPNANNVRVHATNVAQNAMNAAPNAMNVPTTVQSVLRPPPNLLVRTMTRGLVNVRILKTAKMAHAKRMRPAQAVKNAVNAAITKPNARMTKMATASSIHVARARGSR